MEIIRVLKANKIGPILLIAFTNHALDHMLLSILDADITQRIVRLGRRANDERVAPYSIETLEMVQNQSRLDRTLSSQRRELKEIQEHIQKLMKKVLNLDLDNDTGEIMQYLSTFYPEHFEYLSSPPRWVSNVKRFVLDDEDGAGGWQTAGPGGKAHVFDRSTYAFWRDCSDLAFIDQVTNGSLNPLEAPIEHEVNAPQNAFSVLKVEVPDDNYSSDEELSDAESFSGEMEVEESWKAVQIDEVSSMDPPQVLPFVPLTASTTSPPPVENTKPENTICPEDINDVDGFFDTLGFEYTPSVPHSDRSLEELQENVGDVWEMSASERQQIHTFWAEQTRLHLGLSYMDEFERLRKHHASKLRQCDEGKEEVCYFIHTAILEADVHQVRRSLLQEVDIIGCTTTGPFSQSLIDQLLMAFVLI